MKTMQEIKDKVASGNFLYTEAASLLEQALRLEAESALYWEHPKTENLVHTDDRFYFNYEQNTWHSEEICNNGCGSIMGIGRGKRGLRIPLYLRVLLKRLNNPTYWDIEV